MSILNIHWKDWCRSWSSNTLATWCKEPTHWKRPWCWERLKAEEEGDDRGCDGWMASLTQWTCVWASSGRWWRTGKPGMLQTMGSQRVGHDWATEQKNRHIYVDQGYRNMYMKAKLFFHKFGRRELIEPLPDNRIYIGSATYRVVK